MADEAKLIAVVEARTLQFERALKRIEAQTDKAFRGGAGNVGRFNRGLDQATASASRLDRAMARVGVTSGSIGAFGKGLVGGIVGGIGVGAVLSLGGAITKARDALAQFDEIGKQARVTGLTPEFLQSLSFAAVETGISQEKLNGALLIFAKNAGLAADGTGALYSGLRKSNPELLKAIGLAKTQDERLRLVAEAMRQTRSAAERAALSSVVFGRTGVELTEIFSGGTAALDDFMRRAQQMGLIIDRDLLEKADRLDDQLSVLAKVIDTNLNVALISLGPLLSTAAQAAASFAQDVRFLTDSWNAFITASREAPGGSEMFERFKGLAFDLDLGVRRMQEFEQRAKSVSEQMAEAATRVSAFAKAANEAPEGRRPGADQLKQLGLVISLLKQGTPEAAAAALAAIDDLAQGDSRFKSLADEIQKMLNKLAAVPSAARKAGAALGSIGTASLSDMARESGGRTKAFFDEGLAEARRTEEQRELDQRTDAILKQADELGLVLSEAAARIQAKALIAEESFVTRTGTAVGGFVDSVVGAESGGDRFAKNPDSSATGLGQFIESTWLDLFKRHFPDRAKGMSDATILALRTEAATSRQLIEAYARENAALLQKAGVSVDEAALHLAHFLGPRGAINVLSAAPGTPLQGLLDQSQIDANPTILGGGRTVDDARAYAERRVSGSPAAKAAEDALEATERVSKHIDALKLEAEQLRRTSLEQRIYNEMQAAGVTDRASPEGQQIESEVRNIVAAEQDRDRQQIVDGINQEIAAIQAEGAALNQTTFERERANAQRQLELDFLAAGLPLNEENARLIDRLAAAYGNAATAAEDMESRQQQLADSMDAFRDGAKDVLGGFISDLRAGKSGAEALGNALDNIADKLIDMALNSLITGLFGGQGTGGGGLFGGLVSGLLGGIGGGAAGAPMNLLAGAAQIGPPGEPGIDGTIGPQGPPGLDGAIGLQGESGLDGAPGGIDSQGLWGEAALPPVVIVERAEPQLDDARNNSPEIERIAAILLATERQAAAFRRAEPPMQVAPDPQGVPGIDGVPGMQGARGEPGEAIIQAFPREAPLPPAANVERTDASSRDTAGLDRIATALTGMQTAFRARAEPRLEVSPQPVQTPTMPDFAASRFVEPIKSSLGYERADKIASILARLEQRAAFQERDRPRFDKSGSLPSIVAPPAVPNIQSLAAPIMVPQIAAPKPPARAEPAMVRVMIGAGEYFDARVVHVSGHVAAETVRLNNKEIPAMLTDRQRRTA